MILATISQKHNKDRSNNTKPITSGQPNCRRAFACRQVGDVAFFTEESSLFGPVLIRVRLALLIPLVPLLTVETTKEAVDGAGKRVLAAATSLVSI